MLIEMSNPPNGHVRVLYVVMLVLYILGASFSSILTVAGLLMTVYVIVRGRRQTIIEVMVVLSSFAGIMKVSGQYTLYNLLFVVAILRLLWLDRLRVSTRFLTFSIVIAIVSTTGLFFSEVDTVFGTISFLAGLIFAGLAVADTSLYDIRAIVRLFAFGIIVSSVVFMLRDYLPGIREYVRYATYKMDSGARLVRFSGLIGNPNHYTLLLSLAIMGLLAYLVAGRGNKIDAFLLIVLLAFGIYSLSKSFFLGLLFSILIAITHLLKNVSWRLAKFTIIIAIICLVLVQIVNVEYIDALITRVFVAERLDVNYYTTGRVAIFRMYIEFMIENLRVLFLGNGLFNPLERDSHSFYIETIYSLGLIGTFMVVLTYFGLSKRGLRSRKTPKRSLLNYAPLLVFLFRGLAINVLLSILFPVYLVIMTLFIGEDLSVDSH